MCRRRRRRRIYPQPFRYLGLEGTIWTCFSCKTQNEGNICWICKDTREVASKLPDTLVCKQKDKYELPQNVNRTST